MFIVPTPDRFETFINPAQTDENLKPVRAQQTPRVYDE